MPASIIGTMPFDWDVTTDQEGHRDYNLKWNVETPGRSYGPDYAMTATGLPTPGASLNVGSTVDAWAFYQRKGSARLKKREERRTTWVVTTNYTTRPGKRCNTAQFDNPLLEPHTVSGGYNKYTAEAVEDQAGAPIANSAGDRFTGPVVTRDFNRPTLDLSMNVAWIDLDVLGEYVDAVNDATWWGQDARVIKCSEFDWERVLYGTCTYYFIVRFGFELKADKWDFSILDEGDTVLDAAGAREFNRNDKEDIVHTLLDGAGAATQVPVYLPFRVYTEKDFSTVGWPASLF